MDVLSHVSVHLNETSSLLNTEAVCIRHTLVLLSVENVKENLFTGYLAAEHV